MHRIYFNEVANFTTTNLQTCVLPIISKSFEFLRIVLFLPIRFTSESNKKQIQADRQLFQPREKIQPSIALICCCKCGNPVQCCQLYSRNLSPTLESHFIPTCLGFFSHSDKKPEISRHTVIMKVRPFVLCFFFLLRVTFV